MTSQEQRKGLKARLVTGHYEQEGGESRVIVANFRQCRTARGVLDHKRKDFTRLRSELHGPRLYHVAGQQDVNRAMGPKLDSQMLL